MKCSCWQLFDVYTKTTVQLCSYIKLKKNPFSWNCSVVVFTCQHFFCPRCLIRKHNQLAPTIPHEEYHCFCLANTPNQSQDFGFSWSFFFCLNLLASIICKSAVLSLPQKRNWTQNVLWRWWRTRPSCTLQRLTWEKATHGTFSPQREKLRTVWPWPALPLPHPAFSVSFSY